MHVLQRVAVASEATKTKHIRIAEVISRGCSIVSFLDKDSCLKLIRDFTMCTSMPDDGFNLQISKYLSTSKGVSMLRL